MAEKDKIAVFAEEGKTKGKKRSQATL